MNEAERFLKERLAQQDSTSVTETPVLKPAQMSQHIVSPLRAWKNFIVRWTIKGRASRSEYWWVALFSIVGIIGFLGYIDAHPKPPEWVFAVALGVFFVALIPWNLLVVRRLHDTNHSGGFLLVKFMVNLAAIFLSAFEGLGLMVSVWSLVFEVYLLCLMVRRSDPTANRYGPVPNTAS